MPLDLEMLLSPDEDFSDPVKRQATAAALRRQYNMGTLGQLMGTQPTQQVGAGLQEQAQGSLRQAIDKQTAAKEAAARAEERRVNEEWRRMNYNALQGNRADLGAARTDAAEDRTRNTNYRLEDQAQKQFLAETADLRGTIDAVGNIMQLGPTMLGREPNSAEQQSILVLFQKFLDPTSVVREAEFARGEDIGGSIARVNNLYDRIAKGERLNEDAVKQIMGLAQTYDRAAQKKIRKIATGYSEKASQRQLDPNAIITNPQYLQPLPEAQPAPAPAAAPPAAPKRRQMDGKWYVQTPTGWAEE
jgi:hypothetical protein